MALVTVTVGGLHVPAPAAAVGYTSLRFREEFNDTSGIDTSDTRQPGYNFYIEAPFGYPGVKSGEGGGAYSVSNSIIRLRSYRSANYRHWLDRRQWCGRLRRIRGERRGLL
jgi:hypothetical protein